jgi:RNA polymerase sigma-70 factor (ECF subfamily)
MDDDLDAVHSDARQNRAALSCPGQICRRAHVNWAMRFVDSPDDAEDLAGEICVHCLQGRSQFRGDAAFSTWLRRVAINVLRDFIRSKRAKPSGEWRDSAGVEPAEALPPSADWNCVSFQATGLYDAMKRLTPKQRHLIEWKYGDQLTYEEIAARLDTTPAAVSQALRRARLSLKQAIEETTETP